MLRIRWLCRRHSWRPGSPWWSRHVLNHPQYGAATVREAILRRERSQSSPATDVQSGIEFRGKFRTASAAQECQSHSCRAGKLLLLLLLLDFLSHFDLSACLLLTKTFSFPGCQFGWTGRWADVGSVRCCHWSSTRSPIPIFPGWNVLCFGGCGPSSPTKWRWGRSSSQEHSPGHR